MSLFEYLTASISTILAVWAALRAHEKHKTEQEGIREERKVKTREAIKNLEKALSDAQFSQVESKVDALNEMFRELKVSFREISKQLTDTRDELINNRHQLRAMANRMETFVTATEKRLNEVYGKVKVIESKYNKSS